MILIDSGKEEDVRQAKAMGWVKGITTNPTLLAQTGLAPAETLHRLNKIGLSPLFYQLVSKDLARMEIEAKAIQHAWNFELVLKIAPTLAGLAFVSQVHEHQPCAVTAVYSPAQALAASQAGALYVIVYVNRATRLMGDGLALVTSIARVLQGSPTTIMAASIKSADEAAAAVAAGAQHLTVPLDVLTAMIEHPLSAQAIEQFDQNGVGILAKTAASA